jgi:Ran GTPase-activating protein (RanGAP) involved in mRNA processing and transport
MNLQSDCETDSNTVRATPNPHASTLDASSSHVSSPKAAVRQKQLLESLAKCEADGDVIGSPSSPYASSLTTASSHNASPNESRKRLQSLDDLDIDSDEEADVPLASRASIVLHLIKDASDRAHPLLFYLKVRDIVYFHFGNRACRSFCIHEDSTKLIVPVLHYKWAWMPHIHLPTVEVLNADNMAAATAKENSRACAQIKACEQLRTLYCNHNDTFSVHHFSELLKCKPHMKILDLAHNHLASRSSGQVNDKIFRCLPQSLKILHLNHNELQDEHLSLLCDALEELDVRLTELQIRSNYFEDSAGWSLSQYLKHPSGSYLSLLDLRANRIAVEGAQQIFKSCCSHGALQKLRLGHNMKMGWELSHQGIKLLADEQSKLLFLDIANAHIGDTGIARLAPQLAGNQSLIHLELAWNDLSPYGMEALALGLQDNSCLQILDLRDNRAGNEGALALAMALTKKNRALQKLLLARNEIEDEGATSFVKMLEQNPSVVLDLAGNEISFRIKTRLRKHLLVAECDLKV